MASQAFDFDGPKGYRLSGRIEGPEAPRAWAIFAHCFTCGKDSLAATRTTRALAARGVGVLRFDFAGLGGSQGKFGDSTFAADVADLVAAGQAMAKVGKEPSLLIGHSLGGAASLMAAGMMPNIRAVVTIGAPYDLKNVLHQFDPAALEEIEANGQAEVHLAGRPFFVHKDLIDALRENDLRSHITALKRPVLVMHAPGDDTVYVENAAHIFAAAKHPKSFISLDDADHLLTQRRDADYVADLIAAWSSRYLPMLSTEN
ncbi:alpha/beta hydrolase family protein [Herminiimonas contaminans]|uniref:Alpha/beta hydrolase n=1 Tax=Herminiimonas contaminans TaxID=1111140 RepID=A0ABS0EYL5_9BURK|nr:alpha/beta hydrolase [Herminiimonas contaminans]